jgi:tripartite-type tricarboxylate transporter receptor subunit TctC
MKNMKDMLSNTLVMLLSLSMVVTLSTAVLAADSSYPSKVVRMIVSNPPGGTLDLIGRFMASKLSERLGKQMIVENRPGAGSILGTELVAKSAPDGYTLLIVSGAYSVEPAFQKLPYDPIKSFAPIAVVASVSFGLVVHPSIPANSVNELIALAKQKPGQLIFTASGIGATPHMATELLKAMAGIDIKIVQFKGSGPLTVDLLGGHSHATIISLPSITPYIKSGQVRLLAVTASKRSVFMPDVPTMAESGLPVYDVRGWYGILAPAGTPAPVVNRLNKEITAILASDEAKKWFSSQTAEPGYLGPAEFTGFLEREIANWKRVVKMANIKVD